MITLLICFKIKIDSEILFIKLLLSDNVCPIDVVQPGIRAMVRQFRQPKLLRPNKCPVYLKLQRIGVVA